MVLPLFFFLVFCLVFCLFFCLVVGLVFGLFVSLVFGLVERALLRHVGARLVLWQGGLAPWRMVRFMNELSELGVMYRVGGGYRFRHRTLSRWIADEWFDERTIDLTRSANREQSTTNTGEAR
jgi:hypothetical protein